MFFDTLPPFIIYIILFFAGVLENLIPPLPGDTVMLFGAYLSSQGVLSFDFAFISTTAGSVAGYIALFAVAYKYGVQTIRRFGARFFSEKSLSRAEEYLRRYGYLVILINRFLPGLRSVISIVTGYSRCRFLPVLLLSMISASVWNFIWMYTVYKLGGNWEAVKTECLRIIALYNRAAIFVLIVLIVVFFVVWLLKKWIKKA
ncbi:MAG TPA: DedA family protein [Spirochaetota bacterium]|nr:DedA family protein [Spirochaetota bacterium]